MKKVNLLNTIKENKKAIITKAILVAGSAAGLLLAYKTFGNEDVTNEEIEDFEESLDEDLETESEENVVDDDKEEEAE